MPGDERSRFCHACKLHVYNLSALTEPEALSLLQEHEGRLCARVYRRADGTVLTQDCPVGVAALRAQLRRCYAACAAAVIFFTAQLVGAVGLAWLGEQAFPTRGRSASAILPPAKRQKLMLSHSCSMGAVATPDDYLFPEVALEEPGPLAMPKFPGDPAP
jgi:hypothetical protein